MKKVIFSLAVILLSAGAVVATTTSAKAKSACTSCSTCHCPVCGSGCGMSCSK